MAQATITNVNEILKKIYPKPTPEQVSKGAQNMLFALMGQSDTLGWGLHWEAGWTGDPYEPEKKEPEFNEHGEICP